MVSDSADHRLESNGSIQSEKGMAPDVLNVRFGAVRSNVTSPAGSRQYDVSRCSPPGSAVSPWLSWQ